MRRDSVRKEKAPPEGGGEPCDQTRRPFWESNRSAWTCAACRYPYCNTEKQALFKSPLGEHSCVLRETSFGHRRLRHARTPRLVTTSATHRFLPPPPFKFRLHLHRFPKHTKRNTQGTPRRPCGGLPVSFRPSTPRRPKTLGGGAAQLSRTEPAASASAHLCGARPDPHVLGPAYGVPKKGETNASLVAVFR